MEKREKAAARIAQEIVQTIYNEGLRPGQRYLSEADALVRHGVSRATFREALRFLEFQGVIIVRAGPGGGAVVQKPDWPRLASTFALLLQFADATLADVMAARAALEPSMAMLAAAHANDAAIVQLSACIGEAQAALADAAAFTKAYRHFWQMMAAATGNAVTALLWPALRALVDSGGFVPNERYRGELVKRMQAVLKTVKTRNPAAAGALLEQIDREFSERLENLYPQRISRPMAWTDVLGD